MNGRLLLLTLGYQAFTLVDGALRVLVLLHLHQSGRSPYELLLALLPYEVAGVATNLLAGWLGERRGQRLPQLLGLGLQTLSIGGLWWCAAAPSLGMVIAAQLASGIAKDLVKTGAKASTKALAGDDRLFAVVALLTGAKNATKGLGFFVGGGLLAWCGAADALLALLLPLLLTLLGAVAAPGTTPAKPPPSPRELFAHDAWLNWLAAARLCLFASRDAWFAIALPLGLATTAGWSPAAVGGFLAAWTIGYGALQALTPRLLHPANLAAGGRAIAWTTAALLLPLLGAAGLLAGGLAPGPVLVTTLGLYGVLFAVDSSLHSWLVVAHGGERVALQVGFYYAANAVGRVLGVAAGAVTFASAGEGRDGLVACLAAAAVLVVAAAVCSAPLGRRR